MKPAAAALVLGLAASVAADPQPAAWDVTVPERVTIAAGGGGTIDLSIQPGPGRTVSRDGPVRIDVRVPDGVTTGKRRLSLADAVDPGAATPAFAIKVGAVKPGSYAVELGVRAWVCLRQTCKPVRTKRTVTVDVTATATGSP